MAKTKKKSGQLGLRMGLSDERIPKLFGLLLMFIAVYLTIAFVSYLFTWIKLALRTVATVPFIPGC